MNKKWNYTDPIDLLYHIRLGQNALLGMLNPTKKYLPYWNCRFENGDVKGLWHSGSSDRCHNVARAIHGLSMAENVTGENINEDIMKSLTKHLFALFDEGDGLPGTIADSTGKRFIELHNIRETLHALTALIKRKNSKAKQLAHRMINIMYNTLDEEGEKHIDRLPSYVVTSASNISYIDHQPEQEGRMIDSLIRYYRVTEDEVALKLASLLTKFTLNHCFTADGYITEKAGTHGHSITALVAGMLDLASLTNDKILLYRVKTIFDTGLPCFNSSFGWSMEWLDKCIPRGESNNTGDILRASLHLGQAGFTQYYDVAEKILRGHLLPSQVINIKGLGDTANVKEDYLHNLSSRIQGGFSFPTPNDLIHSDLITLDDIHKGLVTYDITSGAVDALCEAWQTIITKDTRGIRINLIFNCQRKGVYVKSFLSGEGRVDIKNTSGQDILIRIPKWVSSADINLVVNGADHTLNFIGSYLLVPGQKEIQNISVKFPIRKIRTIEDIAYRKYTIDWCGDQIVAVSPAAKNLPFFPPCK